MTGRPVRAVGLDDKHASRSVPIRGLRSRSLIVHSTSAAQHRELLRDPGKHRCRGEPTSRLLVLLDSAASCGSLAAYALRQGAVALQCSSASLALKLAACSHLGDRTAVREKPAEARSALGVIAETLPIDDDARLIADDPSVMARCHSCEVAGAILHFFAIVHHDLHPA